MANMVMNEGYGSKIASIVVADAVPSEQEHGTPPCGTCRHLIWQFGTPETYGHPRAIHPASRRQGWRLFLCWKSRSHGGRPHLSTEVRELIAAISRDNHLWGTERIRGELLKLGIVVSNRSIRRFCAGDRVDVATLDSRSSSIRAPTRTGPTSVLRAIGSSHPASSR